VLNLKTHLFNILNPLPRSRFNKPKSKIALVTNREGGSACARSAEYRLVSLLLTNFVTDQFYRSAGQGLKELDELLGQVDPLFVAKAAIYTRNEFCKRLRPLRLQLGSSGLRQQPAPYKR
jgi:60 kDa SS-A/Ro ribonucleoprotein